MPNIPGASNIVPSVVSTTETIQRGVAVPIGLRTLAIMGEGRTEETIVGSANGGGNDGWNPTFTSTNGADGRHFIASSYPIVENRSQLLKNGTPLNLLEQQISSSSFDPRFDARLDIDTGKIELQAAVLVDQGGAFYSAGNANVGNGLINTLTLIDANAPAETWTIRCTTVRRDGYGNPIDGYARFIAKGSVSGILLDGYGNQVVWQSNGTLANNTVLSFAILDGLVPFQEGDYFTIKVAGGGLVRNDNLVLKYIPVANLNDPVFFTDMNSLVAKHGAPSFSTDGSSANRLSLGAQIAFDNGVPGVWAVQCMPSVPRRVSYVVETSATGGSTVDDLTFELPFNVVPDIDSNINFFVVSSTGVELQIIPNKVAYYNTGFTTNPSSFCFGPDSYSYTVIKKGQVTSTGYDGVLTVTGPNNASFSSATINWKLEDIGRFIKIENTLLNDGSYEIISIANDVLNIYSAGGFPGGNETSVDFLTIDNAAVSCRILFTQDLALKLGESLRAAVVDEKDSQFFDAGWSEAYTALSKIDVDMVVPLPSQTISAIFQNGKVHVETMSNIRNKRERLLFIGAIAGLTPNNVIGTTPAAVENIGILEGIQGDTVQEILAGNTEDLANYGVQSAFGDSFRVVYMYPDQVVVQIGADNTLVDGFYMAAAAAAYFSAQTSIAEPLTNKTLSGFSILRNKLYPPIVQENIVNAGITLVTPVTGGGLVVWGKTTTISLAAEEQEISIVFIRDTISKAMRRAFLSFIGRAESTTLPAALFQTAQSLMLGFLQQKLITDYAGLVVKRDDVEPRQWNVSVAVQPVYPVNWIWIKINVGRL